MENTEDLCPAFFDGDRGFPYDLCGLCFLCASVFVKASSVILTLVFELKATAFAWMRAECPRHNGCRLLHGYGQAFKPDSEIPSEAGFANQGGTEGMENTEDLCPAFFEGDRWFPYDLCGLCFLCASVVVKASSVILTSVSGLNQDSRGGTVPPEGQPAMAVRPCRQR